MVTSVEVPDTTVPPECSASDSEMQQPRSPTGLKTTQKTPATITQCTAQIANGKIDTISRELNTSTWCTICAHVFDSAKLGLYKDHMFSDHGLDLYPLATPQYSFEVDDLANETVADKVDCRLLSSADQRCYDPWDNEEPFDLVISQAKEPPSEGGGLFGMDMDGFREASEVAWLIEVWDNGNCT